jgi:O-antigen/teichoic acid export membrane protein
MRNKLASHAIAEKGSVGEGRNVGGGALTSFVELLKRAGIVLAVQVVGAGMSYMLQILLARLLGVSDFGMYSYLVVGLTFAALLAGLGFPAASVRFIPQYRINGEHARLRGFLRTAVTVTFATAVAGTALILIILELLHLDGRLSNPMDYALAALCIPAFAGSALYTELARSAGRVVIAFAPSLIARPALISVGTIFLFVLQGGSLSTASALAATLVAAYSVLIAQWAWNRGFFEGGDRTRSSAEERRQWLGVGASLLAATAFTLILMQVDIVLVGAIEGAKAAGIYAAASKTALLVTFVLWAVNAASVPEFASLWTLGRREDLQRLVSKLEMAIFWPSLAISLMIAILAVPLLALFGPAFGEARVPLLILLGGQLANAAAGSVGYLLVVTGHHREATVALALSAVAALVLAGLGTIAFGLVGAAAGTAIGFIVWNGALYLLVVRKVGVHASIFTAMRGSGWRKEQERPSHIGED